MRPSSSGVCAIASANWLRVLASRFISCSATRRPAELRRRVTLREQQGGDASEAGLAVLESQLANAELPDAAQEPETIPVPDAEAATLSQLRDRLV